jgi:hypothetical protein
MIDDAATVDVKKNSDFRKVRILLETINTSTESIHKAAANKAKADANKNNEESNKLLETMAEKQDQSEHKEMYGCAAIILATCIGIATIIVAFKW